MDTPKSKHPALDEVFRVFRERGPLLADAYDRLATTATEYAEALRAVADEAERVPWSTGEGPSSPAPMKTPP